MTDIRGYRNSTSLETIGYFWKTDDVNTNIIGVSKNNFFWIEFLENMNTVIEYIISIPHIIVAILYGVDAPNIKNSPILMKVLAGWNMFI